MERPTAAAVVEGLHDGSQAPAWCDMDREAGDVFISPKRDKVAIVGFASSTRDKAPYTDESFEIWGLNQLNRFFPRFTDPALADRRRYPIRWFEIHNRPMFEADTVRDTDYVGWLRQLDVPVYMTQTHEDMPCSVRYPLERVTEYFGGRKYFTSSPAYEVALAIMLGFTEIHVYGIDLIVGEEYDYQKACMEYWLGQCEGRGIRLVLPPETALLKSTHLYGYVTQPNFGPFTLSMFEHRLRQLHSRRNELLTELNAVEGCISESSQWRDALQLHMRGGTILAPDPVKVEGGSK